MSTNIKEYTALIESTVQAHRDDFTLDAANTTIGVWKSAASWSPTTDEERKVLWAGIRQLEQLISEHALC